MGNRVILRSKNPDETYTAMVDMSSLLAPGETVAAGAVSVAQLLGNATTSPVEVVGSATVALNVISQTITGGLAGNTYVLRFVATTNQANALITLADLSVVSDTPYGS